jgi:hypothetical protein
MFKQNNLSNMYENETAQFDAQKFLFYIWPFEGAISRHTKSAPHVSAWNNEKCTNTSFLNYKVRSNLRYFDMRG